MSLGGKSATVCLLERPMTEHNQTYAPPVCPRCDELMVSLGNATGNLLLTNPPQWDEVFVCHRDRVRTLVRHHSEPAPIRPDVRDYEELR